jgi:hypothetical protein
LTNLEAVCPNCHDKRHQKIRKVVKVETDQFGFKRKKVVVKRTKGKSTKKKKRKITKKKSTNPFEINLFGNRKGGLF